MHTLRIHDPNDNSNNRRGDPHFADEVAEALGEGGMADSPRCGPRVLTAEEWRPGEGGMVDGLRAMRDEGADSHTPTLSSGVGCPRTER